MGLSAGYTPPLLRDPRPLGIVCWGLGFLVLIIVTVGPLASGLPRPTELLAADPPGKILAPVLGR